ncbi:MAG: IS110 family transposase [Nitratireductor sp.]|nr:IS110 family transposase [Nitratireductor sp.]
MSDTIGIDISKYTLDAYWLSKRSHTQFANTSAGLKQLIGWMRQSQPPLVIFESTGAYHRLLESGLAAHGTGFAQVNPLQARRFAEGTGQLAKTDRVDAAILAQMGAVLDLSADTPRSEIQHDLKQLATARQALIKDRTAARARLQTAAHPVIKKQAALRLRQVERDMAQIDETIATIFEADEDLAERADILASIPGIAKVTAFALLTDMPELGSLTGKQAAALAGLAPISRQSGKWQGREHIRGGRSSPRRAIYLPAVVATRFNPDMKAKYQKLISEGKCKKLAITVVMRKLIVLGNVLLKQRRKWSPNPA